MKIKKLLVGAFALTLLAGCAPSATKKINSFETSVSGTAKLTFNSKYKVDVISEKGGMDSFKHDIDDKVTAELDLTADNLYLYVKNDSKDGTNAKTREALLYKDGDNYKYVTTVMETPLSLATEDEAYAKIDELLGKISGSLAGYVDTKSLVFAKDGAYEHKEFGLSTTNIEKGDFIGKPKYENNGKGVKISGDLDYIGYHTDAGISDFPGKDGGKASTYEIKTNEKGYVESYNQTMDAALEMNIMTPAPLVTIKGSKELSATYGDSLTKKTTIDHAKTTTKLEITESTQGTFETFVATTKTGEKTPVANGADLVVGQFLVVKVTPAGSNAIKMVTFAGSSKETPEADDYFYFEIPEGKASLTVNFVGSDQIEGLKYSTINIKANEHITATTLKWFVFANGAPGERKATEENKVPVGSANWASITVTVADGYKVTGAKTGDKDLMFFPQTGEYCFEVSTEKTFEVVFTVVAEGSEPEVPTTASFVAPSAYNGGSVEVYTFPGDKFAEKTAVVNGTELEIGYSLAVKANPVEGASVTSIKINGKTEKMNIAGFSCFVVEPGENTLEVVFGGTVLTAGKASFTPTADVTEVKTTAFTLNGQNPEGFKPVALGADLEVGPTKWISISATVAEGKAVDKIFVNGIECKSFAGQLCFNTTTAGVYNITVTTKAAA